MRARDVIPLYSDGTDKSATQTRYKKTRQKRRGHTRRSAPELFSAAQSNGLCPGARTTFARSLDLDNCTGGLVVVGGGIKEDTADGAGGPGVRGAGSGGGSIRVDGDEVVIRDDEDAEGAEEMRWALSMAGKAGGESSSGVWMEKEGFVGVVGDSSSSSVAAGLLCCTERVGNHERR
jgi:hypothetical protein